MLYAFLICLT